MQNRVGVIEIEAAEIERKLFRQCIADRVGMAESLAFDDLDAAVLRRCTFRGFYDELLGHAIDFIAVERLGSGSPMSRARCPHGLVRFSVSDRWGIGGGFDRP